MVDHLAELPEARKATVDMVVQAEKLVVKVVAVRHEQIADKGPDIRKGVKDAST